MSCLAVAVVIGFGVWLIVEEFFLYLLEGVLKFWEETRQIRNQSNIMVTLKGVSKGKTGKKWHMLPLVYMTG